MRVDVHKERKRSGRATYLVHVLGCDVNKPAIQPASLPLTSIKRGARSHILWKMPMCVRACVSAYIHFQWMPCDIRDWYTTQWHREFKERITSMSFWVRNSHHIHLQQYICVYCSFFFRSSLPLSRSLATSLCTFLSMMNNWHFPLWRNIFRYSMLSVCRRNTLTSRMSGYFHTHAHRQSTVKIFFVLSCVYVVWKT